ncbi:MAG: DUF2851 family protein [Bacteroidetes bacterium]|nr:DUF2851 family protein [Bacteroidota bacterium]
MNEALLQFIWKYSLYHSQSLTSTDGEAITVIHPGQKNTNAGPDFESAKIKVGNTTLVGNVELHVRSSDWLQHKHDSDEAYRHLILHVVYQQDVHLDNQSFATLVLSPHISDSVIRQYTTLQHTTHHIPCSTQLQNISVILRESWLNRLLAERWEMKLEEWKDILKQTAGDWQNLLYWRLAANFGFKINATPFLLLAKSIPISILAKHKDQLFQLESILFGQAGLLDKDFSEEYPQKLKTEYDFLRRKYNLQPLQGHLWKFMRMRPPNFPTVRIAQFAALVQKSFHLFSKIIEMNQVDEIFPLLQATAGSYWDNHYHFEDIQSRSYPKAIGDHSIHNIIMNTIAPIQFLFAHSTGNLILQEQALQLLISLPPEKNRIISEWSSHHWQANHAAHSQALLQLFNQYCSSKRCLECAIGLAVMKREC